MAYEKHTWECGETITDAKMNNIENGIEEAMSSGGGGEPLIVSSVEMTAEEIAEAGITGTTNPLYRLDTPTADIETALRSGRMVLYVNGADGFRGTTMLVSIGISPDNSELNQGRIEAVYGTITLSSPYNYPYLIFNYSSGNIT